MFRRIALALAFVAALGAAGLGMTNTAEARHGYHGHRGHGHGHGHRGFYGAYYAPYGYYPYVNRASYYPGAYYYGPPVYRSYYGGYGHGCHDHGGVSLSIGF